MLSGEENRKALKKQMPKHPKMFLQLDRNSEYQELFKTKTRKDGSYSHNLGKLSDAQRKIVEQNIDKSIIKLFDAHKDGLEILFTSSENLILKKMQEKAAELGRSDIRFAKIESDRWVKGDKQVNKAVFKNLMKQLKTTGIEIASISPQSFFHKGDIERNFSLPDSLKGQRKGFNKVMKGEEKFSFESLVSQSNPSLKVQEKKFKEITRKILDGIFTK